MGGQGPGHKSVRAIEARLKNIQKARAARKRAPLPWRSGMESRIIEQLVWQWWVTSGGDPNGQRPWAKLRVARFLGVSHTWVNKLVKRFEADPDRMRRKMAAFAPASIDKLERAREETRWEQERGRLRGPIRYRRVKVMLQGKKTRVVAATRAGGRRRQAEVESERARLRGESPARVEPDALPVGYEELPAWARGFVLPGQVAMAIGRVSDSPTLPAAPARQGKPRMVRFALRGRKR